VQLSRPAHVLQLLQLLRALCPGALRPCDAIMSALLSCGVELGSLDELTSWLAFTLITFLVVLRLSPEEAVLGRLQASASHVMSSLLLSNTCGLPNLTQNNANTTMYISTCTWISTRLQ
jgi:hypothetical protein